MGENVNFSQKHISVERGSYMKKNRFMAMLAAICILLTIPSYTMATQGSPYVNDEGTQPVDLLPVGSDIALHSVFVPVSSKWPSPTRTITSNSQFPLKVYNNEVVLLQGNLRYDAKPGESPISVVPGALAAIIIQGNVTLNGANASGTTGATAAIHVPASSSLTIYSAEDQSRSTDRSAPAYSLTVTGGSGGNGGSGGYGGYDLDKAHPRGCHRDIFRVLGPGRRNGLQRIRDGERPAEHHRGQCAQDRLHHPAHGCHAPRLRHPVGSVYVHCDPGQIIPDIASPRSPGRHVPGEHPACGQHKEVIP